MTRKALGPHSVTQEFRPRPRYHAEPLFSGVGAEVLESEFD